MLFDLNRPYTFDRIVRLLLVAGFIWAGIGLLGYLSDALVPFAVAGLCAYLVHPLVLLIQKKLRSRTAAVIAALFLIALVMFIFSALLLPVIAGEIMRAITLFTDLFNNSELAQRAASRIPENVWKTITDYFKGAGAEKLMESSDLRLFIVSVLKKILPGVWGLMSGVGIFVLWILGLGIIGLYLVFILIDYESVSNGWKRLIPASYREPVVGFVSDFNSAMNRYFRAQALVALIVGLMFSAGFVLIGLPLGLVLGLFIGLLNMVPYLQILGLFPALILAGVHALDTGASFWIVLLQTGLVFVVVQLIQDIILVPRIMGKVTGLSPAIILLSLSIWGSLLGFLGLIIALPVTCLVLTWYRRFLGSSEKDANLIESEPSESS